MGLDKESLSYMCSSRGNSGLELQDRGADKIEMLLTFEIPWIEMQINVEYSQIEMPRPGLMAFHLNLLTCTLIRTGLIEQRDLNIRQWRTRMGDDDMAFAISARIMNRGSRKWVWCGG